MRYTGLLVLTLLALTPLFDSSLALAEEEAPAVEDGKPAEVPAPSPRVVRWLERMDRNGDGKISKDEAQGLMRRLFDRNDDNGDGVLDAADLAAISKRLDARTRGARRGRGGVPVTEQLLAQVPDTVSVQLDIAYRDGKSKAWRLDLAMPKAKAAAPRPAIVFVHGGGWRAGDKRRGTFWRGAIDYAQKGYVCITVNYRLIDEAPLPACIEDVKCAVRWLRAHAKQYGVDPLRIGAYGNSAGAHLVCMLGLAGKAAGLEGDGPYQDQSSLVQAVCASATPTDFRLFEAKAKSLFKGTDAELAAQIKAASPVTHVRKDAPAFLLVHGTKDRTVDVKHSDSFFKALKQAGASDVTYERIEDAGHGVFTQHRDRTEPAMEKFFARTLRK